MVLGPCTCTTRVCENTLNVHGCHSSDTGDYFCDDDQLFYDINTFVYNNNGDRACNVEGGSTSLQCTCSSRSVSGGISYSPPVSAAPGGFWPATAGLPFENHQDYNSDMPLGPCQCDLVAIGLKAPEAVLRYASIGDDISAAYCEGIQYGRIYDQPNGVELIHCNSANQTNPDTALPGATVCRCVTSTAKYYGAASLSSTAVAGPSPIQSRVASLGQGSESGGTSTGGSSRGRETISSSSSESSPSSTSSPSCASSLQAFPSTLMLFGLISCFLYQVKSRSQFA